MTTPIPPELPSNLPNKKTDEIASNHMKGGIRWTDPGVILILVAAVTILTIGGLFLSQLYDKSANNANAAKRLGVALSSANNCIKVNCGTPVSTPKTVPVPEPSTTTIVIQAPTPAISSVAIQTAVNTYLEQHPPPVDLNALRAFVNNYLNTHPVPTKTGPSGPSGASGSPGQSGLSGQSGLPGESGASGQPAPSVTNVTIVGNSAVNPTSIVLSFQFSDGSILNTNQIQLPKVINCPSTRIVTPPSPLVGDPGDPTTTYPVCVPK